MADDNKTEELEGQAAPEAPVDPWAAAFASIAAEGADGAGPDGEPEPEGADAPEGAGLDAEGKADAGAGGVGQADAGGAVPAAPADQPAAGGDDGGAGLDPDFTEEAVAEQVQAIKKTVADEAVRLTAELFIEKNIRHDANNRLGASLNDPDIYRKDENGVPTFYNPDTGKPFTGDNPRAQARAWVREYNEELKETFNQIAGQKAQELEAQAKPMLDLLEFAPKFERLDPIRQQMLDSLIEDYAIEDASGDVVGYSCDLDKALAQVNRQIKTLQSQAQSTPQSQPQATGGATEEKKPASSPAVDMKAGAGSQQGKPQFKNIAEAMEWEQDQLLRKMKEGKR